MTPNPTRDVHAFLQHAFQMVNLLDGRQIGPEQRHLNDAQTLAKKVVMHVEASVMLARAAPNRPDHASLAVLVRAAYESVLLLHYVFLDARSKSELRYERWRLCGLKSRAELSGFRDPRTPDSRQAEAQTISRLESAISTIVSSDGTILMDRQKVKYSPSRWRNWKPGWSELATIAGFHEQRAAGAYSYLCGYSHGDSWSVMQIDQAGRAGHEPHLADTFVMIGASLLAELLDIYPRFMPVSPLVMPDEEQRRADLYRAFWRETATLA